MIPFVIVACLTADPAQCKTYIPTFMTTLDACEAAREAQVVLWARDHRNQTVTTAYCMPKRPLQGR